ncbi:Putative histidinol-phosphate aminotransferase; tyrosine/phenylalanine aminotransferase (hisC) [Nostocoides japonicum T1-X7]|uniref:Aromatic amino acid aminotransferase n=1 Tax=Nostocoides japonicum T1-X7 TaxID=1194083 RepID=A0A077M3Z7_9MICO|nr:histidinol-phosphate transaminase [Tetrasphaera japonica]CCH79787.1 Putative histidinol-phosphate aminotransferase; tyrosine/phenylalanine aminotransferase (hisC) [Tetrasphaera japonica T1-X7]
MSADDVTTPRVRIRAALAGLPAYVAGKPAAPRTDVTAYKISSNENPYPPLPSVLEVVRDAAGEMNRYPDMGVSALTHRIAEALDVDPACIATGTGSVGVLGQIVQALCDAGDEVVYAWRSFEAYPIVVALTGARSVQVAVDDRGRHRLEAMREAVTERTKVVIVCTPNNPTGPAVTQTELRGFVESMPEDVLIVVDEAYVEFVTNDDPVDSLPLLRDHPNVVVLRTFSKAYGLAGLRVGYAVASPPVAEALRKTAVPFGVSTVAQRAAVASLDAYDELDVRVKQIVAERDRVVAALRDEGWDIPDSEANFVWFPLGDDAVPFAALCDEHGLTVRPFAGDGVRATIGEPEASDRLIDVASRWRAGARPRS